MKKHIKLITTSLCTLSLLGAYNVTFANERGVTETNSPITSGGVQSVAVSANQGSVFSVTIPKKITLENTIKGKSESNYTVEVRGDIASNEVLKVTPDNSFNMNQDGGRTFPVSVTQTVTTAVWNEMTEVNPKTISGNLSGTNMTAGDWQGTFNFNISLDKKA